jgi:predicted metal-dependent hydrolase
MSSDEQQVSVAGTSIDYRVTRSDDATEPRIDVGIHAITVVLPAESDIDPDALVAENGRWVLDKKREYDRYREDAPDREFAVGEEFPFLGDSHAVTVEAIDQHDVSEGELRLAESRVERSSIRDELERLYKREARQQFERRAEHYRAAMEVSYDRIELRNQRTRWGSCSPNRTLAFNWRLIMAPADVIDYVVVHELAHLREKNHTTRFWELVGEHDPEYTRHAEWLEVNSSKLIFAECDP